MDELNILNVLGQNDEAQEALREILSSKYPTLEPEFNLSAQIIDKYFDWSFNFEYTADGGGLKRWKTVINSYCGRHPKLNVLQQYFTANDTNATLDEVFSGEDITEFTDNRESTSATGFNAVGNNSTTTGLSNEVKSKFTDGKNTTKNVFKHGQKRTYADGRTWQEILADTENLQAPIYKFINGWANVLINPCECLSVVDCLPTVSATAKAEQGNNVAVNVRNIGTPTNARFDFDFVLPKGDKGEQGEIPTIDAELSADSENPVQNKVIESALNKKADKTDVNKIAGSFSVQTVDGYSFAKIMSPNTVCKIELADAIKLFNRNLNSEFFLEALPRNLIHITSLNLYNSNYNTTVNNSFDFVFLGGQNSTWVNNKTTTIKNLARDTFFACPFGWAPCIGKVTNVNGEIFNVNAFRVTDTGGIEFIIQSNVSKLYDPTYKITFGADTNIYIDLKGATAN